VDAVFLETMSVAFQHGFANISEQIASNQDALDGAAVWQCSARFTCLVRLPLTTYREQQSNMLGVYVLSFLFYP